MAPAATEAAAGVAAIDTRVAALTFKFDVAATPPKFAMMTEVPTATPTARPDALLIVALATVPDVQAEDAVTSTDDPSL